MDLIHLIDKEYISEKSVLKQMDFAKIAQYFTLDVISDVAFGEPIGFLVRNEDVNGYCQVVEKALPAFEWAAALPMINQLVRLPVLKKMVMPSPQDKSGVGMIMGCVDYHVPFTLKEKAAKTDNIQLGEEDSQSSLRTPES